MIKYLNKQVNLAPKELLPKAKIIYQENNCLWKLKYHNINLYWMQLVCIHSTFTMKNARVRRLYKFCYNEIAYVLLFIINLSKIMVKMLKIW